MRVQHMCKWKKELKLRRAHKRPTTAAREPTPAVLRMCLTLCPCVTRTPPDKAESMELESLPVEARHGLHAF